MKASLPSCALPAPAQMFKVGVTYSIVLHCNPSNRVTKGKEKEGNCPGLEKAKKAWQKDIALPLGGRWRECSSWTINKL